MADVETEEAIASTQGLTRVVTCDLVFGVRTPAEVVLQVSVTASAGCVLEERLQVATDDEPARSVTEVRAPDGARLHVVRSFPGRLTVAYRAVVRGAGPGSSDAAAAAVMVADDDDGSSYERQLYLRPSRYCPSDHLVGFAVAEFGTGPDVGSRVAGITDWIRRRVGYVPGSSSVHDSAEDTLLTGTGTCRDFAHLGVALCRATGIPARFAAVYAPGLSPMDFHAVFETFENGGWFAHDATGLAPRSSLVRIVTGRDAADTAFAAITSGIADLDAIAVSATVDGRLPLDDHSGAVVLA
ncbi:MAG: hypothetical protein JWO62_2712 [Acidimicrobiaceae bacterium]|nr:hypothetical protein [Acidimicrobiaceae bacterium]